MPWISNQTSSVGARRSVYRTLGAFGLVLTLLAALPGSARDMRTVRPDREGFDATRLAQIDSLSLIHI